MSHVESNSFGNIDLNVNWGHDDFHDENDQDVNENTHVAVAAEVENGENGPPVFLKNQQFGSNSFGNIAECNFVLHSVFAYEHQGLPLIQFLS